MQGYVQIYTGDGKGKTTAAIGLTMRALGADKRVWFVQFMKSRAYSEHSILPDVSNNLVLETMGKPYFIAPEGLLSEKELERYGDVVVFPEGNPPAEYVQICKDAVDEIVMRMSSGVYDIVVLDEIIVALHFGLISQADMEAILEARPVGTELVLTGRKAPEWLVKRADLVTEMVPIKHYFDVGVMNRKGIED